MIIKLENIDNNDVEASVSNWVEVLSIYALKENLKHYRLTIRYLSNISNFSEKYIKEVLRENESYHRRKDDVIFFIKKQLKEHLIKEFQLLV